jgi:uroporphyrinogen-III synthase
LRVLVTRPKISAARTAERLVTMGHDPVLLPLSEAVHRPQAARQALSAPYSALAVTSAEALRVLSEPDLQAAVDFHKPIFAVGDATAAAARSAGFREIHTGQGDGQDLAELIAASSGDRSDGILYLAGKPRAQAFEQRLEALGIAVKTAEIYEMTAVEYAPADLAEALTSRTIDAVLLYSQENALRLFGLVAPHADALAGMRVLCISDRTAAKVPAPYRHRVRVAGSPNEDALLALL